MDSTYTISLGDVENYSTPIDSNTYTAEAGGSRNLTYTYNACVLTFAISPATGSATVTWSSGSTTVENGESIMVPFEAISVVPDSISGWTSPSSQTFTPTTATQTVTLTYTEIKNGVFIVDTSGNLVTTSAWSGGSNCTGVAVITDQVSIIVAPDEWYTYNSSSDGAWNGNTRSAWGGYGTTVTGIKTTTSSSDAITDFAGSANTDAIISQLKGKTDDYSQYYTGAPAAEYCRAYSKGYKGAGQWYLPSAGEMNVIVQNRAAVEEALNKISGELFETDDHSWSWTSTQYSAYLAWYYDWSNEGFYSDTKYSRNGVRPVCAF